MTTQKERDRQNEYQRRYRAANREKVNANACLTYQRNKEKRKESQRQRRISDPVLTRANDKAWREKNPDKVKSARKRYNEKHKTAIAARQREQRSVEAYSIKRRAHYAANRERILLKKASTRYRISTDALAELSRRQAGRCAGCGQTFNRTPHIDHDHKTGQVRGLLCFKCNSALGCACDSPHILRALAEYVERHASVGRVVHA